MKLRLAKAVIPLTDALVPWCRDDLPNALRHHLWSRPCLTTLI